MRHAQLQLDQAFRVVFAVRGVPAAEMVLAPGAHAGAPDNRHRGADPWLYVVSGEGVATVDDCDHALRAGSLRVIGRGERHAIRNSGRVPLKTLNLFSLPAYADDGEPLAAGEG